MSWLSGIFSWFSNLFGSRPDSLTIAAIQAQAVKLCAFLPTVETVIDLVAVTTPSVSGPAMLVLSVAKKICSIVTNTQPVAQQPIPMATMLTLEGSSIAPPVIETYITPDGVTIQGSFVK